MNQNFNYSNSFGFDQIQPQQQFDNHQPQEIPEVIPFFDSETKNELYKMMEDFTERMNQELHKQEVLLAAQREQDYLPKSKQLRKSNNDPKPIFRYDLFWGCYINSIFYDDDDDEESTIPLNEIISQITPSIVITPVLPTIKPEDSLIMGDEHFSTILEKESDEVIKSSVEDLVPIPSESKDTSDNDNFTSSDDESLSDEDVPEDMVKIYSNPLFKFDDEYISSDVNPLFYEVLENIESEESYVSNLDEPAFLVTPLLDANKDECFDPGDILLLEKLLNDDPSSPLPPKELYFEDLKVIKYSIDTSPDFEDDYYDSEGDIIYLESLLINDTIPNLPPGVFLDHDPKELKG
ncbi:hypothetical protein Tco_1121232 [Tanacetum coccineum]|uniref:Reverse transcriptase domain-containing protein n=1 Tax=Tanacetum coccineum TaxID=301880 RepID=A0ABQ5IZB7_9ASTR